MLNFNNVAISIILFPAIFFTMILKKTSCRVSQNIVLIVNQLQPVDVIQKYIYDLLHRPKHGNDDLSVSASLPKSISSKSANSGTPFSESYTAMWISLCQRICTIFLSELSRTVNSTLQNTPVNSTEQRNNILGFFARQRVTTSTVEKI